ncbi:UNVERIFIED_CONTAM: hypothetical protein RF653_14930 [Kocuria sp. CPCC 205316]|uniref:hypothetical protein n=1 Tax=Kocuria TaxID=57493 RepID=UPI0036DC18D4
MSKTRIPAALHELETRGHLMRWARITPHLSAALPDDHPPGTDRRPFHPWGVSSGLLVAVEDRQVVGVQQDPDLPADQPDRHRAPPDRSEQLDLAPGACCRLLGRAVHTASSSDDRGGSGTS